MIEIIPNWHPIWVHFAIALLIAGTVFYAFSAWRGDGRQALPAQSLVVARWMLWLGAAAALVSFLTGYWASTSVAHDDLAHANMMVHRNWAAAATSVFVIAAAWEWLRRHINDASKIITVVLLAGAAILLVTGKEGAENVYEHGLGVMRLPEVGGHDHDHGEHGASEEQKSNAGGDGHSHVHTSPDAAPISDSMEASIAHPAVQVAERMRFAIKNGDADELAQLLDPNVVIFESGNVESSFAEYQSHHMKSDFAFIAAVEIEVLSRKLFAEEDMATVISRSRLSGSYKDRQIDLVSTETLVMQKQGDTWKVVHIHWSSS